MAQETGSVTELHNDNAVDERPSSRDLLSQILTDPDAFALDEDSANAWQAFVDDPDTAHPALAHLRALAKRPGGESVVNTLKKRSPGAASKIV